MSAKLRVQPENPAYTGVVEAKGTQEEGHVGEAPVQPETPAYTGVVEAKGTQEEGHVGEAPVQPENPAYTGVVKPRALRKKVMTAKLLSNLNSSLYRCGEAKGRRKKAMSAKLPFNRRIQPIK